MHSSQNSKVYFEKHVTVKECEILLINDGKDN